MSVLIKGARIPDEQFASWSAPVDIRMENGRITDIAESLESLSEDKVLEAKGAMASPGFFDPRLSFCEPGHEHKEDIRTGTRAAFAGGVTGGMSTPDLDPETESLADVEFLIQKASAHGFDLHPLSLVTRNAGGEDLQLVEMHELAKAGLAGFAQRRFINLKDSVLLKALEYSRITDKPVFIHASDYNLIPGAFVNEGQVNVRLGLRGIPKIAEWRKLKAALSLAEYTGGRMHIMGVSTKASVDLIKQSRENGAKVTCDVSLASLLHNDSTLLQFDTNYKLDPCLREEEERNGLLQCVLNGTIDAVVSNHTPQHEDDKKCELKLAGTGVIEVQTLFSGLLSLIDLPETLNILAYRNRATFGIEKPEIKVGAQTAVSLFDEESEWVLNEESSRSKSVNSYWWGKKLRAKVNAVVSADKIQLNS